MRTTICLVIITFSSAFSSSIDLHPLSDEFINLINSKQSTWRAGRNFDKNIPISHIRGLLGTLKSPKTASNVTVRQHVEDIEIPESFDARETWPQCKYIRVIRDQSACGSCWAVAATSSMTDRLCIQSNGARQVYVSEEDLLSCCENQCGFGCDGGYPLYAWLYWQQFGIVSGGPYNSTIKGCRAYSLQPCDHQSTGSGPQCDDLDYKTPKCTRSCDSLAPIDYESDKTYGKDTYKIVNNMKDIQLEIMKNGPVEAAFTVFTDFMSYKSGVYQRVAGLEAGSHAVRVLGWGVENGTPYWLAANSWNEDWGDNGFFKILRGSEECEFENDVVAGMPRL